MSIRLIISPIVGPVKITRTPPPSLLLAFAALPADLATLAVSFASPSIFLTLALSFRLRTTFARRTAWLTLAFSFVGAESILFRALAFAIALAPLAVLA